MSDHHIQAKDLPAEGERLDLSKIGGLRMILGIVGIVGLVLSAVLFFVFTEEFSYSWLFGFYFVWTIILGGLFWTLIHHATNSGWGIGVRRVWENIACLIPVMAILFVPFLFPQVQEPLYEWVKEQKDIMRSEYYSAIVEKDGMAAALHQAAEHDAHKHLLIKKLPYLNIQFFYIRVVLYFLLLGGGAFILRRFSKKQDVDGEAKWTARSRMFSCGFIPIFAVMSTFMAIDMLKTLDYTWFSTMWGVYIFAGAAQSSMAVSIIVVYLMKRAGYLGIVNEEHFHVMGKLLHAFVIFWAYIAFSQYFLIWYANMAEETKYFFTRNINDWNIYSMCLWIFRFLIPFAILLFCWLKRTPKFLAIAACWIVFAHAWDMYHIVIPERSVSLLPFDLDGVAHPSNLKWVIMDLVPLITISSIAAFFLLNNFHKHRTYPARDPRLHETLGLSN